MQDEVDLADITLADYIAGESGCYMELIQQSDEDIEQFAHFSHDEADVPMSIIQTWVERYYLGLEYEVKISTFVQYTEFRVKSSFEKLRVTVTPDGEKAFTLEVKKV